MESICENLELNFKICEKNKINKIDKNMNEISILTFNGSKIYF